MFIFLRKQQDCYGCLLLQYSVLMTVLFWNCDWIFDHTKVWESGYILHIFIASSRLMWVISKNFRQNCISCGHTSIHIRCDHAVFLSFQIYFRSVNRAQSHKDCLLFAWFISSLFFWMLVFRSEWYTICH